jgi:2-haloacid dehalogenase
MKNLTGIKALAFDAYGTLFDVHSVVQSAESMFPGSGLALSQMWRSKQLEYMFLRSLMGRYVSHEENTEAALVHCVNHMGFRAEPQARRALMAAYERLSPFPDAVAALPMLKQLKTSILSVGTPELLRRLVSHSGLEEYFDELLSVDSVKIYKPHPRTYQLVIDAFGVERHEVGFVSSNYFDVAGATAFGFKVIWINRFGVTPDELGLVPSCELKSLAELPHLLGLCPA